MDVVPGERPANRQRGLSPLSHHSSVLIRTENHVPVIGQQLIRKQRKRSRLERAEKCQELSNFVWKKGAHPGAKANSGNSWVAGGEASNPGQPIESERPRLKSSSPFLSSAAQRSDSGNRHHIREAGEGRRRKGVGDTVPLRKTEPRPSPTPYKRGRHKNGVSPCPSCHALPLLFPSLLLSSVARPERSDGHGERGQT
jgi:hypothetical protein